MLIELDLSLSSKSFTLLMIFVAAKIFLTAWEWNFIELKPAKVYSKCINQDDRLFDDII